MKALSIYSTGVAKVVDIDHLPSGGYLEIDNDALMAKVEDDGHRNALVEQLVYRMPNGFSGSFYGSFLVGGIDGADVPEWILDMVIHEPKIEQYVVDMRAMLGQSDV